MALFSGSRSSSSPNNPDTSSNYINKQKRKQIESLREQIPGVVEITRDEKYSVPTTVNGITLTLSILLPQRFPMIGPEVSVYPPIKHPWVNDKMVVDGSPLINNFTIHSKLGRAVDQVIKMLLEQPPQQLLMYSYPTPSSSISPSATGGFSPYTYSSSPHQTPPTILPPDSPGSRIPAMSSPWSGGYRCPRISDRFEEVSKMSLEELKSYLNDTEDTVLIDQFVSKLDAIKQVHVDKEHLLQDNEDRAGSNLRQEPEIQDGWTDIQEKYLKVESLKEEHDKKLEERTQLTEKYQKKTVVAQLKSLINGIDIKSEVYADDFLDAKVPVTEFIQQYKQQRKLHHLRQTKYEKLLGH